jgi:hypothetical protein
VYVCAKESEGVNVGVVELEKLSGGGSSWRYAIGKGGGGAADVGTIHGAKTNHQPP